MWRIFSLSVVVCLVCLFAFAAKAQNLKVNETETRAVWQANQLQTNLILENPASKFAGKVRLEVLDAADKIIARKEVAQMIRRGTQNLRIPLVFPQKPEIDDLLWYRLRYQIAAGNFSASGIVALSEIMPELFELSVSSSEQIYAGMLYPVRVRAFHPTKNYPVANVKINAQVKIELETDSDEDKLKIEASGLTDKDGFAVLEFKIPENVKFSDSWSGEVEVRGEKNNLQSSADDELRTEGEQTYVYFLTDKPLYQPSQKIYIRGFALQSGLSGATTVAAEREFEFFIRDEDGTTLYRETVKTSRFGVAAIEWQIPDNAKLGSYKIEARGETNGQGLASFKVSRYELPNFVVQTKSDKEFYLPEENTAEVTIDALYLFGKPVARGKVKVVEESEREWNYKEQKWDVKEEAVYEGETDAEGKYVAKIDLSKAHARLKEDENDNFDDLHFTAYYTDFSTNKTEQRRFDLRVSKEPVHVYFIGKRGDELNPKMPLRFYVSTESANGEPISCDVEIRGKYEDETEEKILAVLKTNSFGMGRVEIRAPRREDGIYVDDLELKIVARDAENRAGTKLQKIEMEDDEKQLSIRTDKAIYRQGEPLQIEIISSEANETVFVDVSKNWSKIVSRTVKLKNGRAELKIPYDPNFKSSMTVSAYFEDDGEAIKDARNIVYPTPKNLRIETVSSKEVYRPNEEANLNFAVFAPGKKQTESALGVVILDKAVEERARTDAAFGGARVPDNFQALRDLAYDRWDEIDLRQPLTDEIQLYAEARFSDTYFDQNFFGSDYEKRSAYVFKEKTEKQFAPLENALRKRFSDAFEYPKDDVSLRKILSDSGIDFDALRDPWNSAYKAKFSLNQNNDVVEIESAGPNKIFGDEDDFTALNLKFAYFTPTGLKINQAVNDYFQKTGKFVRDAETLRAALRAAGIDLDALKDRWGNPYKIDFGIYYKNYTIAFQSEADKNYKYDDFTVWTTLTEYFAPTQNKIEAILSKFINEQKTFPKDETEFKTLLKSGGVDFENLRDAWNRPYYIRYEILPRSADKVKIENVAKQGEPPKETITVTPVMQQLAIVHVRTFGEDGVKSDQDWNDFDVAVFVGIISEQAKNEDKPKIAVPKTVFANGKSALYGVVTDETKAVVPNAVVNIINAETQAVIETKTNAEGVYLQTNLAAGKYTVKAFSNGFKTSVVNEIKLESEKLVEVNFTLQVGTISETVFVTSGTAVTIDASDTRIDTNITRSLIEDLPKGTQFQALLKIAPGVVSSPLAGGFQIDGASGSENTFVIEGRRVTNFRSGQLNAEFGSSVNLPVNERKSTPRLREYFPETLLWLPEVVTDKNGKAEIKFRLADNITTWKIYAVASDAEGKIGIAEKEIRAFQPFFVDLEPPKFLTQGDEIFLPVQVRNYTKEKQKVGVEMAGADWFSFLGAAKNQIEVNPNATQNAVFGFRAERAADDGRQKVTAIADTDSDAIEKSVTVKPNGQEIVKTDSNIFRNSAVFEVNFPSNALPETQKVELKIYPNLFAHVTESVEGLLQRPHGCGEQTISSTYPNLMIQKFVKEDSILKQTARVFLKKGYDRLLGYKAAGGGFTYWGKGEPNIALTAYAYRFLTDAREFIAVDEGLLNETRDYLVKKQTADGSFDGNLGTTAYVARTLARNARDEKADAALRKSLAFLKKQTAETDEPYALALYGLALLDAGMPDEAKAVAARLENLAQTDGSAVYWNLQASTPFYGWGTAGRVETTALVMQLLIKNQNSKAKIGEQRSKTESLISGATVFLLKNKDRYGVWYSTQTTINVLDGFLAALANSKNAAANVSIEISLNGENLQTVSVAPDQITPIYLYLSEKISPSANKIEIKSASDSLLMAQTVATHYIDWRDAKISEANKGMRLDYRCDKTDARIMDEVTCSVEARRSGLGGYGMLLAEIGVPPGADVSRESLEKALQEDWSISRYEVLPDKIIVYFWAKDSGTRFNFKFKPRYGINAQTPASVVYDYYNEEAKATAAPLKFNVK